MFRRLLTKRFQFWFYCYYRLLLLIFKLSQTFLSFQLVFGFHQKYLKHKPNNAEFDLVLEAAETENLEVKKSTVFRGTDSIFQKYKHSFITKTESNLSIKHIIKSSKGNLNNLFMLLFASFFFSFANECNNSILYWQHRLHIYQMYACIYLACKHYWKYYIERLLHFRKITTITTTVTSSSNQWPLRTSVRCFFLLWL